MGDIYLDFVGPGARLALAAMKRAEAAASGAGSEAAAIVEPLVEDAQAAAGFGLRADALAFAPKMSTGDPTTVRETDTGTHAAVAGEVRLDGTAATAGEQIPNEGGYTKQSSGALWRTRSTGRQLAAIFANAAAASAASVAGTSDIALGVGFELLGLFKAMLDGGLKIGDPLGNALFGLDPNGLDAKLKAGSVSMSSLDDILLENNLALQKLRQYLRYTITGGMQAGDPLGNFTVALGSDGATTLTITGAAVGSSAFKSDVPAYDRRSIAAASPGVYDVTTISSKSQIVRTGGSGQTTVSDGTANDTLPRQMGDSVRFASDRDTTGGATVRAFRMEADKTQATGSVVSERGGTKIYILIGYGQSNAIGTTNDPVAAYSNPAYLNSVLMFNSGVRIIPNKVIALTDVVNASDIARLVPAAASMYASGVYGQTLLESLAYRLMATDGIGSVIFTAGVGGASYAQLKKGTVPYNNMITTLTQVVTILRKVGIEAEAHVFNQQGEADSGSPQAVRIAQNNELTFDLNVDIPKITGQSAVHVFAAQIPSASASQIPIADWLVGRSNPLYHCVGPTYDLPGSLHYTSLGHYYLGELYYRAVKAVIVNGGTWQPLGPDPTNTTISGAVITVPILGATGSVVSDMTNVSAIANLGAEYTDNSSPPAISSTVISGGNIVVTLASAPTATAGNRILRFAYTRPVAGGSNTANGARTNIADSDPLASLYDGKALPKRLVHSEIIF